jgi:hypothetical protein
MSVFVSCKKKLPSNIKSAVIGCELSCDNRKVNDSTILNLTKKDMDTLSKKTIDDLLWFNEYYEKDYKENSEELKELLKINPEYSDYEEVKKMKEPYYHKDISKFFENLTYLDNRSYELMKSEYIK